ncbi:potassium-transporting ATPase subunit KdpA [Devriesea agamarum]|uniref:potassium-transporting ATPase subunit KdpA n=1 Tax=Devriesea agamarum TaxID=472569 RepID=UPI00071D6A13|nr:potassium-transporting ATPase subunit KdpA [Devriesea agamarum]
MSEGLISLWPTIGQIALLIAILAVLYVPLGGYMARIFTAPGHWRIERLVYRLIGADPDSEQTAFRYTRSVLGFSLVSIVVLYALLRLQEFLPLNLGHHGLNPLTSFNTAISFVTNTNWQMYSPEQVLGHGVQMFGLTVQNLASAAVGICVAIALVRGLTRQRTEAIGNFWVDFTRCCVRLLLPLGFIAALALIACGVIQNLHLPTDVTTLTGAHQSIPGGPVASQEALKELGTNGGGFFNANSSHPFENPNGISNLIEILLMLAIPFALPHTVGVLAGDWRQSITIAAVMGALFLVSVSLLTWIESRGLGSASQLAGGAMEGKEVRFGIASSALFGTASTLTSTGAVNSMHDSYTGLGGLMLLLNMQLGEVAPGGVGSGLYGMLILAIVTVFVGGLLVGQTPEYLGKKIGTGEMKLASLYVLTMPTLVLGGLALSFGIPALRHSIISDSLTNTGNHGVSEVLYAFTSAANNNGSAFAGLTSSTPWLATVLGVIMLLGRFVPMICILALAGRFARQQRLPSTAGTLPTHGLQFVVLLLGITVIVTALTFLPVLALGPLAEGLPR